MSTAGGGNFATDLLEAAVGRMAGVFLTDDDGTELTYGAFFDQVQRVAGALIGACLLYTSPSPRDRQKSRMPSSA